VKSKGTGFYILNNCDNDDGVQNSPTNTIPAHSAHSMLKSVAITSSSSAGLSTSHTVNRTGSKYSGTLNGCIVIENASIAGQVDLDATAGSDFIQIEGTKDLSSDVDLNIPQPDEGGPSMCLQAKQRNSRGAGALVPFVLTRTTPLKIAALTAGFTNFNHVDDGVVGGSSTMIWRIWDDANGNGTLDTGEAKVQGGQVTGTHTSPGSGLTPSFSLPAGDYLFTATWQSSSFINVTVNCHSGGHKSGTLNTLESVGVRLEVQ